MPCEYFLLIRRQRRSFLLANDDGLSLAGQYAGRGCDHMVQQKVEIGTIGWVGVLATHILNLTQIIVSCDTKFYWEKPVGYVASKSWHHAISVTGVILDPSLTPTIFSRPKFSMLTGLSNQQITVPMIKNKSRCCAIIAFFFKIIM